MKTYLFFKSTNRNVMDVYPSNEVLVTPLADSYNDSSEDILFEIKSNLLETELVKEKLDSFGTFLTASAAHTLGKELQPDRDIYDPNTDQDEPFTFTLKITHNELKRQCREEIFAAGELEAKTLIALENSGDELTQGESDKVDAWKSARTALKTQYSTDKETLGF